MLWCVWCLSDVQSDFLGFPPLPSCLVNHADISWFWQIWHIYEAGYLSAQQEQKSVSFISLANADRWCSCTIFGRDLQDIPDLQYFAVGRVAIYPESRNLFHYTALMTDPNSRGLTNSGNATICNGSTHWSITGGHLLCSPSHLILLFLHSHLLVLNMKANIVLFSVSNSIDFENKKNNNNNKQRNKSCQQRAVDRRRFAAAFALPINIKRLWTV